MKRKKISKEIKRRQENKRGEKKRDVTSREVEKCKIDVRTKG